MLILFAEKYQQQCLSPEEIGFNIAFKSWCKSQYSGR
jgi:hypothetical protein